MSQVAAQSAIKKNDGEDSLSPFTSDNEDAKPSKSPTPNLTICSFILEAAATPKPAAGATEWFTTCIPTHTYKTTQEKTNKWAVTKAAKSDLTVDQSADIKASWSRQWLTFFHPSQT